MSESEFDIPADLPLSPIGGSRPRRTAVYLAAASAAREHPSRATYRAAAWAAMDLSTAYGWVGSCTYGNVWHMLAHVGDELMQRAIAYQRAATMLPEDPTA